MRNFLWIFNTIISWQLILSPVHTLGAAAEKEAPPANDNKTEDAKAPKTAFPKYMGTVTKDGITYFVSRADDGTLVLNKEEDPHLIPGTNKIFKPSMVVRELKEQRDQIRKMGKAGEIALDFPKSFVSFQIYSFIAQYMALKSLARQNPLEAVDMWSSLDPTNIDNLVSGGGFYLFILMNHKVNGAFAESAVFEDAMFMRRNSKLGVRDVMKGLSNLRATRAFTQQHLIGNLGMAVGMMAQALPVDAWRAISNPDFQACLGFTQTKERPFFKIKKVSESEKLQACDSAYTQFAMINKIPEWTSGIATLILSAGAATPVQAAIGFAGAKLEQGIVAGTAALARKVAVVTGVRLRARVSQKIMTKAVTSGGIAAGRAALETLNPAVASVFAAGGITFTGASVVLGASGLISFLYVDQFLRTKYPGLYTDTVNSGLYGLTKGFRVSQMTDLIWKNKQNGWGSPTEECNRKDLSDSPDIQAACKANDPFLSTLAKFSSDLQGWKQLMIAEPYYAIEKWNEKVQNFRMQFDFFKNVYDGVVQEVYKTKILNDIKSSGQYDTDGYVNALDLQMPLFGVEKPGGVEVSYDALFNEPTGEQQEQLKNLKAVVGALSFDPAKREIGLKTLEKVTSLDLENATAAELSGQVKTLGKRTSYDDIEKFHVRGGNFKKAYMIANLLKGADADFNLIFDGKTTLLTGKEKTWKGPSVPSVKGQMTSVLPKPENKKSLPNLEDLIQSPKETFSTLDPFIRDRILATISELKKTKGLNGSKITKENVIAMGLDLLNQEISVFYNLKYYAKDLTSRVCESCIKNYDQEYFNFLVKLKQTLGIESQPMYEPGRGYLMALNSRASAVYDTLALPKTTGIYSTPYLIDHALMQMICGPQIDKGERAVKDYAGSWTIFIGPKITSSDDNMTHICKTSLLKKPLRTLFDFPIREVPIFGTDINPLTTTFGLNKDWVRTTRFYNWLFGTYPDLMYHQKVRVRKGSGEVAYEGVFDYIRNRMNPAILQSDDGVNTNFAQWWDKYAQAQYLKTIKYQQSEYLSQMANLLERVKDKGQHMANTGPLSNGVFESSRQEFKYYLMMLGELVKDLGKNKQLDISGIPTVDEKDAVIGNVLRERTYANQLTGFGKGFFAYTKMPTFSLGHLARVFPEFKSQHIDLSTARLKGTYKFDVDFVGFQFQHGLEQDFEALVDYISRIKTETYEQKFTNYDGKTETKKFKKLSSSFNIDDARNMIISLMEEIQDLPTSLGTEKGSLTNYQKMLVTELVQRMQITVNDVAGYAEMADAVTLPEVASSQEQ